VKFTRPLKPLIPDTMRVVEADPPCETVIEGGVVKRVKSEPVTCT